MARGKVLVVEDESAIRRGLVDALTYAGYGVSEAPDGKQGLESAVSGDFDLVLLDVLMPKQDGFSVLEGIRKVRPTLPIIMLTARGTEEDKIRGLSRGADDYVVKPFSAKEVLARVEAVLRRSAERPQSVSRITLHDREIDFERREIRIGKNKRVDLSELESNLLRYLIENPGRAIDRAELLANVWRLDPKGVQTRTVDMNMARLREKIEKDPSDPKIILTVRSKGYMLGDGDS